MGTHSSDTCTMRWELYYAHPQSGRTLFCRYAMPGDSWLPGGLQRWKICVQT